MNLEATFGTERPILGMVHLGPLPGAPRSDGDLERVLERARGDATALEAGGVDGIVVENFGDAPFYPADVPPHVVASMTRAVRAVVTATALPVGVNVLRNDAEAALSVATATGGEYVRVNVHAGARVTDQGVVEGRAHETMRLRDRLDADVDVFADLAVKHSAALGGDRPVVEAFEEQVTRGLADAAIVSGPGTGEPVDDSALGGVVERRDDLGVETPVFVGSGVDHESVADVLAVADGAIVGTALKRDGAVEAPVSEERVAALIERADELR